MKKKSDKPHPMGEPVPGEYFAWFEVTKLVEYHAVCVSAPNEEEAERLAREAYDKGEALARTISDQQVTVRIIPQREKHIELHPERRKQP